MTTLTQLSRANTGAAAAIGHGDKSDLPAAFAGYNRLFGILKVLCCMLLICGGMGFARTAQSQDTKKGADAAKEYTEKGVAFLKEKDPKAAVEALKKATELDPKNWRAFYNLGLAYHFLSGRAWKKKSRKNEPSRTELLVKAEASYSKSLELNDTNLKAYKNLGMIAAYRKDYKAAADFFKKGKEKCAETATEKALGQIDDYSKIANAVQHHYISGIMGVDFAMSLPEFRKEVKQRDEVDDRFHPYLTMVHFKVNSPDIDKHVVAWFLVDRAFSPLVGMFYSITRPSGDDPLAFLKLRYPREAHLGSRSVDMSGDSLGRAEADLIWRSDHTLALSRVQLFEVGKDAKGPKIFGRILVAEVHKDLSEIVEKRIKRKGVARDMLKYLLDTSYEMGKDVLDFQVESLRKKYGGETQKK